MQLQDLAALAVQVEHLLTMKGKLNSTNRSAASASHARHQMSPLSDLISSVSALQQSMPGADIMQLVQSALDTARHPGREGGMRGESELQSTRAASNQRLHGSCAPYGASTMPSAPHAPQHPAQQCQLGFRAPPPPQRYGIRNRRESLPVCCHIWRECIMHAAQERCILSTRTCETSRHVSLLPISTDQSLL